MKDLALGRVAACGCVVAWLLGGAGCSRRPSPPTSEAPATTASTPATPASLCGDMKCSQYGTPREAFLAAAGSTPAVIAVGEAHAQKGSTVPSATKRFTDEILPGLQGRASDLLVELMMPPTGCADAAADVRKKQAPATTKQAETNQNEYVVMGERAHALGIVPDMLRPSCADLDGVRAAGDGAIDASLKLIARLCGTQATRLVDRDARSDADTAKAVVVYTGMLHNDLTPAPDRAAWSYAPALDGHVGGRLVSIDLVVPEFITGDPTWTSLPWVSHYDVVTLGDRATLIETGERSYVLVFPRTEATP